jgi:MtrB/PioB family decaheme-associated outer membrane protein
MRSKVLILAVIFCAASGINCSAEERKVSGEISLTAQHLNIEGNEAKYNEYRDIRDGFYGDMTLQYESGNYYLDFRAAEAGRKTQSYELSGGKWGSFKYFFSYDQLPHNFTYDAKSFYQGFGGANLSYPIQPPSTNASTWNTFDYTVERKTYAGGLKYEKLKPFFFNVSLSKETRMGLMPSSAAGTSPGGIALELPAPINYDTDNLKVEAGYVKNPLSLSFVYLYSRFQNDNSNLFFRNPATGNTAATTDVLTLPPGNDQYKLGVQGTLRLPWNSKFGLDLSTAKAHSEAKLFNYYVSDVDSAASNIGVRGQTGVTLNNSTFNGEVDTYNYSLVLTSNPLHFLNGKLFYKYYKQDNKSDQIITTVSPSTGQIINPLFGYRKETYGGELGFRLPASFYVTGAYSRINTQRDREDNPKNNDDLYRFEIRWSGLDFMIAKAGYERLNRDAYFETNPAVAIELYERRYDVAAKNQDTYKASLEFFPIENLNFNLGYKYKDAKYPDSAIGLQSAERNEFTIDADYLILQRIRLFGYFDWEYVKFDQLQRQLASFANSDPNSPPTATNFNWRSTQTEQNYAYGLGTEIYVIPKRLSLLLQTNNQKSNGYADYTYYLGTNPLPAGRTQENIDISQWDDYRLTNYVVKAIYHMTPALSLTGGWAYEKYVYDDAQYNGYQYVPATTGTNGAYLTGAYKDPSYRANVFFLTAAYRF